jgi:glycerol-3-phosphate dehydrogenase subunit C
MANSNRKGAQTNFDANVKSLAAAAAPGYDILTTCPSCNEMLRREGAHLFDSEEARFVAERIYDASEYLVRLYRQGRLDTNFKEMKVKIFYHNPCHLKVQDLTEESLTLLRLIPGMEVVGVNMNCCGMGGSYGMKKVNFDRSTTIAGKVWTEARNSGADIAVTECGGCGLQIQAGTGMKIVHPIVLLNQAYKSSEARDAA